jgi:hypothetical protein
VCLLHPAVRARLKRAAVVMQEKPWREHLKPLGHGAEATSTANHLGCKRRTSRRCPKRNSRRTSANASRTAKAMGFPAPHLHVDCGIVMGDFMASVMEWTGLSPFRRLEGR